MVRQEIYGYLLTHHAISTLICRAVTEADIDPDWVKFLRTVRIVRRRVGDPAAFPLRVQRTQEAVTADITARRHLNPGAPSPHLSPRGQTRPTQPVPGQAG